MKKKEAIIFNEASIILHNPNEMITVTYIMITSNLTNDSHIIWYSYLFLCAFILVFAYLFLICLKFIEFPRKTKQKKMFFAQ